MSSGLLTKSMTNVLRFCSPPAVRWVRLSRDSVCTAVTPESFLSTYIAESSGWSKPVWNLLATSMILYVVALERRRQVRAGAGVHVGLGELVVLARRRAPVRGPDLVLGHRHRAGERDQGAVVVRGVLGGPLGDVGVDRLLVLHRGLAGVGHDHRLGLALQQVGDVGVEVLDDDLHLLADVGRVQPHPPHQALAWPAPSSTSPSLSALPAIFKAVS